MNKEEDMKNGILYKVIQTYKKQKDWGLPYYLGHHKAEIYL